VIDRETYLHLQDVIRREGRSFLQYAGESFPWTTTGDHAAVEQLQQLVSEERDAAARLSRYLAKNRLTPPYLGAYPSYFTSYNYLSLDRLLPLLVDHQKRGIADLQADLSALQGAETRQQVQDILELKKRHLQLLEALATSRSNSQTANAKSPTLRAATAPQSA
jgi:hypothetical protein